MLHVFLVVCNEHVLLVKVKKKVIKNKLKKKTNRIRRRQVRKMDSFIEKGPNQCYLRHTLRVCVKSQSHRIVQLECSLSFSCFILFEYQELHGVSSAMFGNSQINFDYLCDLPSQGKIYFPCSSINVYLRVF